MAPFYKSSLALSLFKKFFYKTNIVGSASESLISDEIKLELDVCIYTAYYELGKCP